MKVYLAGPISGLTYDAAQDWRQQFAEACDPRIECFSPLRSKDYLRKYGALEGSYDESPLSSEKGITSRDRYDCMGADLVLFNLLGTQRISVGTMIEIGWADAVRVPSVIVMEKEGNPHDHPMVRSATNFRVETLGDAKKIVEAILLNGPPGDVPSPIDMLKPRYGAVIHPRGGIE